jgi:hypothetical protein
MRIAFAPGLGLLALALLSTGVMDGGDKQTRKVHLLKTPQGGIQPQAMVDSKGVLHLIYFKGDPGAGDLFYVRKAADDARFSKPLKVNSQAGSAIAVGTIRGGRLALGKDNRVHVAWNGSGKALPKGPGRGSPMLYSRLNDDGTAFEAQRNLLNLGEFLDGGGTVTAGQAGNVTVAWHAKKIDGPAGEDKRLVYVAESTDEGKTFSKEKPAFDKVTGACGCCGMNAFTDKKGNTYLIYRAATKGSNRDMWLLRSSDRGKSYQGSMIHPWSIDSCPMSSQAFAEGDGRVYTAWDTKGQIYFNLIRPDNKTLSDPSPAPGEANGRKHPSLAVNNKGELLLAWTEGTGWQRGGDLGWQVYDALLRPISERGRVAGAIPVWGLPCAVANADGTFTIFH